MADFLEFHGRDIDEVHFTGLIESLVIVKIVAALGIEDAPNLSRDDLIAMLGQMSDEASKALVFSGATADEAKRMSDHMMNGLTLSWAGREASAPRP